MNPKIIHLLLLFLAKLTLAEDSVSFNNDIPQENDVVIELETQTEVTSTIAETLVNDDVTNEEITEIEIKTEIYYDEHLMETETATEYVETHTVTEYVDATDDAEEILDIESTKTEETNIKEIRFYDHESQKFPNTEYLEFKTLDSNNLLASFNFQANGTTDLYPNKDDIIYYDVIPKSLGTILKSTNTRELHIRFGHGWYDAEVNGKLVNNGFLSGGTGVELWATIEADTKQEAFQEWIQLANSLSGMFCASLNFIESSITTTPEKLFGSEVDLESQVELIGNLYHFRSALPREPICTENLTPFLKLLPTKGKQGISTLLNGNKMFNAEWSSMSLDVITDCENGDLSNCKQSMNQAINLILNVPKILEKNEMPIPKPTAGSLLRCDPSRPFDLYNCFPMPPSKEYHYSLTDLFGKTIEGGSLVASNTSKVCLDVDLENWEIELLSLSPAHDNYEDRKLCFNLDSSADYNIRFNTKDSSNINPVDLPPFFASRSLSGYSQDAGGFRLDLHNPSEETQQIVIFETLPWFVRLYLHSLTINIVDEHGNTKTINVNDEEISSYLTQIIYNPAIDRISPNNLELSIEAPPKTKLKFSFKFDKSMLLYAEYPPDANHGFELEPAIFALVDQETSEIKYIMRTTTSLLTLPTPDFSMPYNVIILTLTVMALTFGSLFNLLVKKTVTEEEAEKLQTEKPIEKLKKKVRGIIMGLVSKWRR